MVIKFKQLHLNDNTIKTYYHLLIWLSTYNTPKQLEPYQ